MYTLEGVSSVANFIIAYEESQLNRDSHFLSVMFSFFFQRRSLLVIFYYQFLLLKLCWVNRKQCRP